MNFTQDDLDKGFKRCDDCNKLHILQAGTDYPNDAWVKCKECDCWVVDEAIADEA